MDIGLTISRLSTFCYIDQLLHIEVTDEHNGFSD